MAEWHKDPEKLLIATGHNHFINQFEGDVKGHADLLETYKKALDRQTLSAQMKDTMLKRQKRELLGSLRQIEELERRMSTLKIPRVVESRKDRTAIVGDVREAIRRGSVSKMRYLVGQKTCGLKPRIPISRPRRLHPL